MSASGINRRGAKVNCSRKAGRNRQRFKTQDVYEGERLRKNDAQPPQSNTLSTSQLSLCCSEAMHPIIATRVSTAGTRCGPRARRLTAVPGGGRDVCELDGLRHSVFCAGAGYTNAASHVHYVSAPETHVQYVPAPASHVHYVEAAPASDVQYVTSGGHYSYGHSYGHAYGHSFGHSGYSTSSLRGYGSSHAPQMDLLARSLQLRASHSAAPGWPISVGELRA